MNDFIFIKVIHNLFTHFIKFLEWFVCGFENFINQMVKLPRHATEQPTAWPQWKCFFFPVFFFLFFFSVFFSFYLLFLLKPSPTFFISSFLSPTGFSVRLTSICLQHPPDLQLLLSCYNCNIEMPAWSFLFHFKFISSPY